MNPNAYISGILSTAVISLMSLSGVIILPLIRGKYRSRWMQLFIALAISTLATDAMLHLIPTVLGAHKHSGPTEKSGDIKVINNLSTDEIFFDSVDLFGTLPDENHDQHDHNLQKRQIGHEGHIHDDEGHDKSYLLRMSCIMFTVYAFYIFEFITTWGLVKPTTIEPANKDVEAVSNGESWTKKNSIDLMPVQTGLHTLKDDGHGHSHMGQNSLSNSSSVCFGFKSVALMILIGDGVHNFVDGLAVGASFVVSNSLGFSTAFAVICHELPHEIGDFAVLIDTGLSVPKALIMNLLSAFTAFLGLILGIEIGQNENLIFWLLAIAAGMFLYVAWIDMLNHLRTEVDLSDSWYLTIFLQNAGFIIGFVVIFIIGWFEEDIRFAF